MDEGHALSHVSRMRIALLADIHANRPAFQACLDAAAQAGAEHHVLLGDLVGYGADPAWCVERAMQLAEQGAIVVQGNHDAAAAGANLAFGRTAGAAIEWTRTQLSAAQRDFLAKLPLCVDEGEHCYVHADASAPQRWRYVHDDEDAARHFDATAARISFCGHVHHPALYSRAPTTGAVNRFTPIADNPLPLLPQRRWFAVLGSVGQPRDGDPSAAWCLLDTDANELRFRRCAYDIEAAQSAIRAAGLPDALAVRLERGR